MKKLILLLILVPSFLFAGEEFKAVVQIQLISSDLDQSLLGNEAVFEFEFHAPTGKVADIEIQYSIDGQNGSSVLKDALLQISTMPGKHIFQFYYNDQFYEVYSDSLDIKGRHRDRYQVNLSTANTEFILFKPIIYLYPQLATEVTMKMDIHGEDAFLYPKYTDEWKFTAQPNGDLVFGTETYNYLFWEATTRTILSPKQTASGFFVEGKNAVSFLEDKLTQAGFNSKEQADFITFWGPRLMKNELNFVHFEFNETCDKYANLTISPRPDNIYRIFMTWGAVSERFDADEQKIESINRSGFSVLEWGGKEAKIKQSFVNN